MAEMKNLAEIITLFLGRLTFASLKIFGELGVDMSKVDEALAEWTSYGQQLKAAAADLQTQLEAGILAHPVN